MIDPLLLPYLSIIEDRKKHFTATARTMQGDAARLADNCNSHLYYGLHFEANEWVLREWAPNATAIYLLFEGNDWQKNNHFSFKKLNNENWELRLPAHLLHHQMLYKLLVEWVSGYLRIPYAQYKTIILKYLLHKYGNPLYPTNGSTLAPILPNHLLFMRRI